MITRLMPPISQIVTLSLHLTHSFLYLLLVNPIHHFTMSYLASSLLIPGTSLATVIGLYLLFTGRSDSVDERFELTIRTRRGL